MSGSFVFCNKRDDKCRQQLRIVRKMWYTLAKRHGWWKDIGVEASAQFTKEKECFVYGLLNIVAGQ